MKDIDIWRTAELLIEAHGANASAEARQRAEFAVEDGYPDVQAVWIRVSHAIELLQGDEPGPSGSLN